MRVTFAGGATRSVLPRFNDQAKGLSHIFWKARHFESRPQYLVQLCERRFPHFERVINALKFRRDVVGFRLHSDYQWRRSPAMYLDLYLQSAIDATFLLSSIETSVQAQFAIQNVIE